MKRIISIILVAIMLVSALALTSCEGLFTKEQEQPEQIPTPTPEAQPTPPRTTVTKTEWDANFQAINFTIDVTQQDESAVLKQTDTVAYMQSDEEGGVYYLIKGGKTYCVSLEGGKWEAVETDEWEPMALVMWSMNADIPYESFTYDEAAGAYVYTVEHATATVRFEDGVVKSLVISYGDNHDMTREFVFSNIGTTTVEVPSYEVNG